MSTHLTVALPQEPIRLTSGAFSDTARLSGQMRFEIVALPQEPFKPGSFYRVQLEAESRQALATSFSNGRRFRLEGEIDNRFSVLPVNNSVNIGGGIKLRVLPQEPVRGSQPIDPIRFNYALILNSSGQVTGLNLTLPHVSQ